MMMLFLEQFFCHRLWITFSIWRLLFVCVAFSSVSLTHSELLLQTCTCFALSSFSRAPDSTCLCERFILRLSQLGPNSHLDPSSGCPEHGRPPPGSDNLMQGERLPRPGGPRLRLRPVQRATLLQRPRPQAEPQREKPHDQPVPDARSGAAARAQPESFCHFRVTPRSAPLCRSRIGLMVVQKSQTKRCAWWCFTGNHILPDEDLAAFHWSLLGPEHPLASLKVNWVLSLMSYSPV